MDSADFNCGDQVCVPCNAVEYQEECPEGILHGEIVDIQGDSFSMSCGGKTIDNIPITNIRNDSTILIITLGDFKSEFSMLDPIAKSILHFGKLLHRDDCIRYFKIRSIVALKDIFKQHIKTHDIIVFNGHGTEEAIEYGLDASQVLNAAKVIELIPEDYGKKKIIVSLSCKTGSTAFGKAISESDFCKGFVGPSENLQGAIAAQYCQTFLFNYLFSANEIDKSHDLAIQAIPGADIMKLHINE